MQGNGEERGWVRKHERCHEARKKGRKNRNVAHEPYPFCEERDGVKCLKIGIESGERTIDLS